MKGKSFFLYVFLALGISICLTQTTAFAQASIVGDWLVDITGEEKGGAVLTVDNSTFTGYAFFANKGYVYPISGVYGGINNRGKFTGRFNSPHTEDFTGALAKNRTFTLTGNRKKYKGTILPIENPAIPQNWTVKVSKVKKPFNTFESFEILPQGNHRIFTFSGSGYFGDLGRITISTSSSFFVTSKNAVYGVYIASVSGVDQTGFLSGTIKLSSGKFTFKLVSNEGEKSTLTGTAVEPQ
jgi:hypothetical protein